MTTNEAFEICSRCLKKRGDVSAIHYFIAKFASDNLKPKRTCNLSLDSEKVCEYYLERMVATDVK